MAQANEVSHRAMRVLIVEDEPRLRELLADVVPEMGFPARPSRSAEEALRILREEPVDILILDLQLPAMGGMELLEQVRREWPATQVIILTGFGDLAAAQQAIRLDVVEFLTKPCHLRDIELALDHARRRVAASSRATAAPASQERAQTLADAECRQILAALSRHGGNKTAAAAELGISRRKLHYRLAEYRAKGFVD
jgi:DNA-binding NtrC family response regulator